MGMLCIHLFTAASFAILLYGKIHFWASVCHVIIADVTAVQFWPLV